MGKRFRFRDKICAYCDERKSTSQGDHLIARSFFPGSQRQGLIKLPCCKVCNDEKSRIEHYLASVMPLGGRHVLAVEAANLTGPRLAKNPNLREALAQGSEILHRPPHDSSSRAYALPFIAQELTQYSAWLALGLIKHHWKSIGHVERESIRCEQLTLYGDQKLRELMLASPIKVGGDLGEGTFQYEGHQVGDGSMVGTVWRFSFLGGFLTTDRDGVDSNSIWALTGNNKLMLGLKEIVSIK